MVGEFGDLDGKSNGLAYRKLQNAWAVSTLSPVPCMIVFAKTCHYGTIYNRVTRLTRLMPMLKVLYDTLHPPTNVQRECSCKHDFIQVRLYSMQSFTCKTSSHIIIFEVSYTRRNLIHFMLSLSYFSELHSINSPVSGNINSSGLIAGIIVCMTIGMAVGVAIGVTGCSTKRNATSRIRLLTEPNTWVIVVVLDGQTKPGWIDIFMAVDQESAEYRFGEQVEYSVEDSFGVGGDNISTLANTPSNRIGNPQDEGESPAQEETATDIVAKGLRVASRFESELINDVEESRAACNL
jgi:hypothetical protein